MDYSQPSREIDAYNLFDLKEFGMLDLFLLREFDITAIDCAVDSLVDPLSELSLSDCVVDFVGIKLLEDQFNTMPVSSLDSPSNVFSVSSCPSDTTETSKIPDGSSNFPLKIPYTSSNFSLNLRLTKKRNRKDLRIQRFIGDVSIFSKGFNIFAPLPLLKFPFKINIGGVHNFTGRDINISILKFLALGANFILGSRPVNETKVLSDIANFHRRLRLKQEFLYVNTDMPKFYVPNPTYMPSHGSNDLEFYIKQTKERLLEELQHSQKIKPLNGSFCACIKSLRCARDDICILHADKNLGLVLVSRSEYDWWKLDHLWNDRVYKGCDSLPIITDKFHELEGILFSYGVQITSEEYKYILQDRFKATMWGRLYFLVKVHKNVTPPPLRPICSQLHTMSYFASKFVSKMLLPLVKTHVPTYFDDPLFVIEYLGVNKFSDSVVIMAADIENLYPSIDIDDCLVKVELFIKSFSLDMSLNCDLIMSLLSFILKNNFFEIDGLFFRQISGVAMGTPCAVMVSVIYIHMLESTALSTIDSRRKPLYLVRFIDDYFGLFNTISDTHLFLETFNTQHASIRIPNSAIQISSAEENIGINFLDFSVYQPCNSYLRLKLFSKPFHCSHHQYIHFCSRHPLHVKTGFIKSELNRIFLRCSSRLDCLLAFNIFYDKLRIRGYPSSFLDPLFFRHVVHSSTSEDDYIGKRLHHISCRLILKYNRKTSRPLVYKRIAGSKLPLNKILSTECIVHAPSFLSVFMNKKPVIVTYGVKKLGSFFK